MAPLTRARTPSSKMWHSLRVRLILSSIIVVLIAVGVTAFVATRRTTGEFQRYVERRGPMDGRRLAFAIGQAYRMNDSWEGIQDNIEQMAAVSGERIVIVDEEGLAEAHGWQASLAPTVFLR